VGGWLADRWLGRRFALIAGGAVMALGHFLMAFEGTFLLALVTLIVGVGLFKGNIASQVGELYKDGDLRRAMAVGEEIETGMVGLNRGVVSDPAAPFGGAKQSGIGREGGHHGLMEFLEPKYFAFD
jgi:MFS family permease